MDQSLWNRNTSLSSLSISIDHLLGQLPAKAKRLSTAVQLRSDRASISNGTGLIVLVAPSRTKLRRRRLSLS
jgi:hypothetical protein